MLRKFSLPRQFAILGAALFLMAGAAMTYLDYRLAVDRISEVQNNASMVASRTLWSHLQNLALSLFDSSLRTHSVRGAEDLAIMEIDREARDTLLNTDIDKIKLYDGHGRVIYSTDRLEVGEMQGDNPRFRAAMTGQGRSYREIYETILTVHGYQHGMVMHATYVPVYDPNAPGPPIGVFKTYMDFSKLTQATRTRAWIRFFGLVIGLAVLYLLLVLVVARSDRALRQAEEERGQALAEVTKARAEDASKSAFLAHMSHELRTPLNAILGFSEFIEKSRSLNLSRDKIVEYAGDIHVSASHLLRIINDLLDLTRLDLGRIRPEFHTVKVTEIVDEALAMVSTQAAHGLVALKTEYPADDILARTDRQRVKQILVNLLSNAVKFTPEGGSVTAAVSAHPDDNLILMQITDTGIGMSGDETSDRINVLKYGDAMIARKMAGVGLGLPLCHRYAKLLGGDLRIASELGKGTRATLELPLRPAREFADTDAADRAAA